MTDMLVTCVSREPIRDTYVGITHLGGPGWRWPRQEVVRAIDAGEHTFYVSAEGRRVEVAVIRGAIGDYLRTRANRLWTDHLISLPVC